jgi:hypothetical protein
MTTGVTAVPAGRPSAELQVGVIPAYHLSSAVSDPKGSAVGAASLVIEPDHWLPAAKGLILGGRAFGESGDTYAEPFVGYRQQMGDLSFAGVVYASSNRAEDKLASYHGFRAGAEVVADGRVASFTDWLQLHAQVAASLTRVVASGTYCVDTLGKGVDCDEDVGAMNTFTTGRIRGFYPGANVTVALDLGRVGWTGFSHARLAVLIGTGFMPTADDFGEQGAAKAIVNGGLSLTLGFGAK